MANKLKKLKYQPGPEEQQKFQKLANDIYREINKQKDQILKAFIAETGINPSECEQVTYFDEKNKMLCWYIRKRKN